MASPVGTIHQFNVKLNFSIAMALILLGVCLIYIYSQYGQYRDLMIFSSAIFAGFSTIYLAYYAGKTLKTSIENQKIHNSFEIRKFTSSIEFMRVRAFIEEEINHEQIPPSEVYEKVMSNKEILFSVRTVLNNMEGVSIAIQKNYADEDTLFMSLSGVVPRIFRMYENYIKERRRLLNDPAPYCEYEKLVKAWGAGKYLSTGLSIKV